MLMQRLILIGWSRSVNPRFSAFLVIFTLFISPPSMATEWDRTGVDRWMYSSLQTDIPSDRELYLTLVRHCHDRYLEMQSRPEIVTDFDAELWLTHPAHHDILSRHISTIDNFDELYTFVHSLRQILGAQTQLFDLSVVIEQLVWNDTIQDLRALIIWKKTLERFGYPPLQMTYGTYRRLINRMSAADLTSFVSEELPRRVHLELLSRGLEGGGFARQNGALVKLLLHLLDGARVGGEQNELEDQKALKRLVAHTLSLNWAVAHPVLMGSNEGIEILKRLKLWGIEGMARRWWVMGDEHDPPRSPSSAFLMVVVKNTCEGWMARRNH